MKSFDKTTGLVTRLVKPFKIIPQVQAPFWTFVLVTIALGQAGFLLPLLCNIGSTATFRSLLCERLVAGSFYTFSISLIASRVTPFVIEYFEKKEPQFRIFKGVASLFAVILLLVPMIALFARLIAPPSSSSATVPLDRTQLLFYVLSMFACLYLFCLSCLHHDYESYSDLDQQGVVRLKREGAAKTQDSQGNTL